MIPFHRPAARRLTLAAFGLAALALPAMAELRPAVLPAEICLVLSNGPFDAEIAARIAGRGDFADILLQAEAGCPELAGSLIGATASIPDRAAPNRDTGGPTIQQVLPVSPPGDSASIPVTETNPPPQQETTAPPTNPDGDGVSSAAPAT